MQIYFIVRSHNTERYNTDGVSCYANQTDRGQEAPKFEITIIEGIIATKPESRNSSGSLLSVEENHYIVWDAWALVI
jgi:hypothetical protein